MDAVELARQRAWELHEAACKAGGDPTDPYAFALGCAEAQEIDVEPSAVGGASLGSARAKYSPTDQLITHENVGTPFDQAFLVAHELGHAMLGDSKALQGSSEDPLAIDPTRSCDPAASASTKVVDYGPRERREIQLDIFARELLLPRPVLRRLHLKEGLTASEIAGRFHAPFIVASQQILDAILLPTIRPIIVSNEPEKPLNAEQKHAADHRGSALLLEAGPGTGKTQTLIARVRGLLGEGVDPRTILLLTFSNRAAGEMAARIARTHSGAAAAMTISTFHAFGMDLTRRLSSAAKATEPPRLLDAVDAVALLEQIFPALDLVHYRNIVDPTQTIVEALSAISRAKDEVRGPEDYAAIAREMHDRATSEEEIVAAERAGEIALIYHAYEEQKALNGRTDFGDLVMDAVKLLESDPGVRATVANRYQHVLVDEYQDVNRASVRLLKAIKPDGANLWAVGDARQSIYRFRGASPYSLERFEEDFPNAERARLRRNYRSRPEIVSAFSQFGSGMLQGQPSTLDPVRASNGMRPTLSVAPDDVGQSAAIAEAVERLQAGGIAYKDQAVLCTGNERLAKIAGDLERLGIPVLYLGSLFERIEIRRLLSVLSLLDDDRAMGLLAVGAWDAFPMSLQDVADGFDDLRDCKVVRPWVVAHPDGSDGLSFVPAQLVQGLRQLDASDGAWTLLARFMLDQSNWLRSLASSDGVEDRTACIAIWQLMNYLRDQAGGRSIKQTLDRIRRIVRLGDDRDLRHLPTAASSIDAVRLMTVHASKGLEFPIVHLPGLNGGAIPRYHQMPPCPPPLEFVSDGSADLRSALKSIHEHEQEAMFYVALSRARDHLALYSIARTKAGAKRPASAYEGRIAVWVERNEIAPTTDVPADPSDGPIVVSFGDRMTFSSSQLTLYQRCPRRFLYTHILGTGRRRSETPFMRMHEAVRTIVGHWVHGAPLPDDLEPIVTQELAAHGISTEGEIRTLRPLATAMLQFFMRSRQGHGTRQPDAIYLDLGTDRLVVRADDVLIDAEGRTILRRVRTGHARKNDADDLVAAALTLAAGQAFPGSRVELVHLSDERTTPIELHGAKLRNRQAKIESLLEAIRKGEFPRVPSSHACPRCPAFHVCGPLPSGPLRKNLR